VAEFDWSGFDLVVNAAAYTAVDLAETDDGRRDAWATNVTVVATLVVAASRHRLTLVHVSTDYVFDGRQESHDEDERLSPLGVYGQTKAAGDALVGTCARHYLVRTSWVIGDGNNFVKTMAGLADRGVSPRVVEDQFGRLTFAAEIVSAVQHLLAVRAPYGTYNMTSSGATTSWADIAEDVFEARGRDRADVRRVSTEEYGTGRQLAPRPRHSTLTLDKIVATGFDPAEAGTALKQYLNGLPPG
jgi:dTDP-4-dehydrorhamnose 3,5-epimerase